jgi:hypothetical protein
MGGKEPIKGGEHPIDGKEETKRNKRGWRKMREMVMEACRWVGRGHATQIGPPSVPIYGPRDPRRRGKGELTAVGKGKGRGRGWQLGKGARV